MFNDLPYKCRTNCTIIECINLDKILVSKLLNNASTCEIRGWQNICYVLFYDLYSIQITSIKNAFQMKAIVTREESLIITIYNKIIAIRIVFIT